MVEVNAVIEKGVPIRMAAQEFNILKNSLIRWCRKPKLKHIKIMLYLIKKV
jgi:transposase-like protein